jgi:hypothetical protein
MNKIRVTAVILFYSIHLTHLVQISHCWLTWSYVGYVMAGVTWLVSAKGVGFS